MRQLKEYLIESKGPKYTESIKKLGLNKISIGDNLEGGYNDFEVNVKYFTKPINDKQVIIIALGDDKYVDFFKNGNFSWEPLTYFEEDEDPKEIWNENGFGECPDWFTKDTLPKSFDELEKFFKKI